MSCALRHKCPRGARGPLIFARHNQGPSRRNRPSGVLGPGVQSSKLSCKGWDYLRICFTPLCRRPRISPDLAGVFKERASNYQRFPIVKRLLTPCYADSEGDKPSKRATSPQSEFAPTPAASTFGQAVQPTNFLAFQAASFRDVCRMQTKRRGGNTRKRQTAERLQGLQLGKLLLGPP